MCGMEEYEEVSRDESGFLIPILINFNAETSSDYEINGDEISGSVELDREHEDVKDGEERDIGCVRDTIEGFCLSTGRPSARKLKGGDRSVDIALTKTSLS
jgi:hypothetical protein